MKSCDQTPSMLLTIAGSDCSGGAGIQADLRVFNHFRWPGVSVITSVTAQNSRGVRSLHPCTALAISEQLDALFEDFHVAGIKIGLVETAAQAKTITEHLKTRSGIPMVIDPIIKASDGTRLSSFSGDTQTAFSDLLRLSTLITPNTEEAGLLLGKTVPPESRAIETAALDLADRYQTSVLVTGGDNQTATAKDCLATGHKTKWLQQPRATGRHPRGTGCYLSSALLAELAAGTPLEQAIINAKGWITGQLSTTTTYGRGAPMFGCLP